ncbi:MAG: hypothetical protein LBU76_08490 [Azoarcus sp.]|nr:hypothetical protein [Azoarcus sp.]
MYCTSCGSNLGSWNRKSCPRCGSPLRQSDSDAQDTLPPDMGNTPTSVPTQRHPKKLPWLIGLGAFAVIVAAAWWGLGMGNPPFEKNAEDKPPKTESKAGNVITKPIVPPPEETPPEPMPLEPTLPEPMPLEPILSEPMPLEPTPSAEPATPDPMPPKPARPKATPSKPIPPKATPAKPTLPKPVPPHPESTPLKPTTPEPPPPTPTPPEPTPPKPIPTKPAAPKPQLRLSELREELSRCEDFRCHKRVQRMYCGGHWNRVPECKSAL